MFGDLLCLCSFIRKEISCLSLLFLSMNVPNLMKENIKIKQYPVISVLFEFQVFYLYLLYKL